MLIFNVVFECEVDKGLLCDKLFLERWNAHEFTQPRKGPHDRPKSCLNQCSTWWTNKILLRLLTGIWVKCTYKEQWWLKSSYITQKPTPTRQKSHEGYKVWALCTACGLLDSPRISALGFGWSEAPPPSSWRHFIQLGKGHRETYVSVLSCSWSLVYFLGFMGLSFRGGYFHSEETATQQRVTVNSSWLTSLNLESP